MPAVRTARERARAELTGEITAAARRQLVERGAAALSLRAVARELGMVSSALYRYFPSRDDLLTALIIEAYTALADAVQAAQGRGARGEHRRRWLAACRAVREWALAHPHEFALIYGSPVPGYRAPRATVEPAARVLTTFTTIAADAHAAGRLQPAGGRPPAGRLARQLHALSADFGREIPANALAAVLVAVSQLLGMITMELGGHFVGSVDPAGPLAEHALAVTADLVGLP